MLKELMNILEAEKISYTSLFHISPDAIGIKTFNDLSLIYTLSKTWEGNLAELTFPYQFLLKYSDSLDYSIKFSRKSPPIPPSFPLWLTLYFIATSFSYNSFPYALPLAICAYSLGKLLDLYTTKKAMKLDSIVEVSIVARDRKGNFKIGPPTLILEMVGIGLSMLDPSVGISGGITFGVFSYHNWKTRKSCIKEEMRWLNYMENKKELLRELFDSQ